AICTGDEAVMAATTCPPKAGFQATSRPSSTSKPTASPVRPAPSRAAARAATSRPQAVLGASTAHGPACSAHSATAPATSSAPSTTPGGPVSTTSSSAPQAPSREAAASPGSASATTWPSSSSASSAAVLSSSWATWGRSASRTTATAGPAGFPGRGTAPPRTPPAPSARPASAPRRTRTSTAVRTWSSRGPSSTTLSRFTSWTRTTPTLVGLPGWPHGPGPRSAADTGRGQRVGAGEGGVGHEEPVRLDAPLETPGDRLPEGVVGARRTEGDDGHRRRPAASAGAGPGAGQFHRLRHRPPAVGVQLQRQPGPDEPTLLVEGHLGDGRHLLDDDGDPHPGDDAT